MPHSANKYLKEVQDLPLWLKYTGVALGLLGTLGTLYGAYGTYATLADKPSPSDAPYEVATGTIKISDIFARYNDIKRGTDQQDFLKQYTDVLISGIGTFDNISKSEGSDNTYYVYMSVSGGLIACQFDNVDENLKRRLDLLNTGDKVFFFGTFTRSIMGGTQRWFIRDCHLN
ncbi:MAG: hypothetical protein Q7R79_01565 [bacterium]|nr:hypothetical protein [bacterium]